MNPKIHEIMTNENTIKHLHRLNVNLLSGGTPMDSPLIKKHEDRILELKQRNKELMKGGQE